MGLAQRRQQKQTILSAWICQKSLCFLPTDESCHFSSSSQCLSLAERREKENGKKKKEFKKKKETSNPKSHHNKLAAEWSCCLAERGDCCAVTDPVREALPQLAGVSMTYQTEWELTEGISATWNGELTWKQWRVRDRITASTTVTDDVQRNDRRILTLLDVSLVVLCVWKSNC